MHLIYKDAFCFKYSAPPGVFLPAMVQRHNAKLGRKVLYDYTATLANGVVVCPLVEPDYNIRLAAIKALAASKLGAKLISILGIGNHRSYLERLMNVDPTQHKRFEGDGIIDAFPLIMFSSAASNSTPSFVLDSKYSSKDRIQALGNVKMAEDGDYILSITPGVVNRPNPFKTFLRDNTSDLGLSLEGIDRINILNSRVATWMKKHDGASYAKSSSLNIEKIYDENLKLSNLKRDLQLHTGQSIFDSEGCYISYGILFIVRLGSKVSTVFVVSSASSKRVRTSTRQGTVEPTLLGAIESCLTQGSRGFSHPMASIYSQALVQHLMEQRLFRFLNSPYELAAIPRLTIVMNGPAKAKFLITDEGEANDTSVKIKRI